MTATRENPQHPDTDGTRFHNRLYQVDLGRTPAGSPVLKLRPLNPRGPAAGHRQMAAFLFELAAELERRSERPGAGWVVSPETLNDRLVLELGSSDDPAAADRVIGELLADFDLVGPLQREDQPR
jgi:hypothetical protein